MTPDSSPADKALHALSHGSANIATLALFVIMLATTADVISRNFLDHSVPGVIEGSEVILVAGAFLGLAYGQRTKTHVATTVLIERLPSSLARALRAVGLLCLSGYIGLAAIVSAQRAAQSFSSGEVRFGLIEFPQWPARAAIAVGFFLLWLEVIRDLLKLIRARREAA